MATRSKPGDTRGPRKQRKPGPPGPRFTTHKVRAQWFQARASYPEREADAMRLARERNRFAAAPEWELAGPTNIGGRMTSLAVHPTNPDLLYIGAAGGGVWKTLDAGRSWTPLWHDQPTLNIGSLALEPGNPDVIYCGTGEANGSADSYPGVGLYRSENGGRTWRLLASSKSAGLPRRIGVIAIDPFDPRHIRIGGVTHSGADPAAMFVSRDRGKTWTREDFVSPVNYWCHDIVFHPTARGVIFSTAFERGARNGIWRSEDGGADWKQLTQGLPFTESLHRTSLAIAPSAPETIYALAAGANETVLGIFRSDDRGERWRSIGGTEFREEGQMTYGNTIVVHPEDPDHVLCGGVDLHITRDGGKTWSRATKWDAKRGTSRYAHADHHALAMPASAPGRVYDANDGGMDVSEDGGAKWTNRSNGLAATMFYDLDLAQSDPEVYGGGTQDNGSLVTSDGDPGAFHEVMGGDGGWMIIDPLDASHIYASCYNFNIWRARKGKWKDVTPKMSDAEHNSVWMIYITMDPNDSSTVYTASARVWKTVNDGKSWKPVSPVLDGSPVTAIEVPRADSDLVYVGTEKGSFYRSTDGGQTWSDNLAGSRLPGKIITRIETRPQDGRLVFLTVGGTGDSHVFRSGDAGTSWTDVDHGRLPDVPHQAIAFRTDRPYTLFVASDTGVFQSADLGETWSDFSGNLPHSMCVDLVYRQQDRTLMVATYGRSLWRTRLPG
jgi:photosystem II stability/assembly factor-like uncharacterized protein